MDQLSGVHLGEGQPPVKDALPCYFCAINNLDNCTHTDASNRDRNANASNVGSIGVASPVAPVHQRGPDLPPSYMTSCYLEMAPNEYVSITEEDQQRVTSNSANSENLAGNDATASGEGTQENSGKSSLRFFAIILAIFIAFWIIGFRVWS